MTRGCVAFTLSIGLALAFATPKAAYADGVGCSESGGVLTCSWADLGILPLDPDVDPNFTPEGTATFELVDSDTLQITLTYTGFDGITPNPLTGLTSQYQTLTGLLYDIGGDPTEGVAQSAMIASGSGLVGLNSIAAAAALGDNLAGEWAYKEAINAGLGEFGVGTIGDINGGADGFGPMDIIDDDPALAFYGNAPDGSAFALVPDGYPWTCDDPNCTPPEHGFPDGFKQQGPSVQNSMVFLIDYDRTLDLSEITNVQPIFGTEGAPLVPEPGSPVLFAVGSGIVALAIRRRRLLVAES